MQREDITVVCDCLPGAG